MSGFGLNNPSPRPQARPVSPDVGAQPGDVSLPQPLQKLPGSNLNAPSRANHDAVSPPGPETADGQKLSERMVPRPISKFLGHAKPMASDGSFSRYANLCYAMDYFRFRLSSPINTLLNQILSMWTSRQWTTNLQAAQGYVNAWTKYLTLTFVGQKFGSGNNVPFFATENAPLSKDSIPTTAPSALKPE